MTDNNAEENGSDSMGVNITHKNRETIISTISKGVHRDLIISDDDGIAPTYIDPIIQRRMT